MRRLGALLVLGGSLLCQPAVAASNDLLVDFGTHGLWLWLNKAVWQRIDTQSPTAVAACDLDADGIDDVIASFPGRGLVSRLSTLQDEEPGFSHPLRNEVPEQIVTGDFDGNGYCDIAALVKAIPPAFIDTVWINLNGNDDVWFRGLDDGTAEDGGIFGTVVVANLDGSPNDDLALYSGYFGSEVAFNDRFGFKMWHAVGSMLNAAGDLDGSAKDDTVLASGAPGGGFGLYVRYDPGTSSINARVKVRNGITRALTVGDLDTDPRDDILVGDGAGVWVAANNTFPFVNLDNHSTTNLAIADFDNDAKSDIAADFGNAGVWIRLAKNGVFKLLRAWPSQALVPGAFD